MTCPLARRAETAAGVRGRSEDQRTRFERTVSALGGLARRTQRDVSRAREVTGPETDLRDVEQGTRLHVEAEEWLRRGAGRPLERARDGRGRFYRQLVAVTAREPSDVRTRALDDELMERIVERLGPQRPFRQSKSSIGLAMGEQRRRPTQRIRGGGRHAGALHLKPRVERRGFAEAHPFEKLSTHEVIDRGLVPFAAQELTRVDHQYFGVDLDPAIAFADLGGRVHRLSHLTQRPAHRTERVVRLRPQEVRELTPRGSARLEEQIGKKRPGLVALEPA